MKKSILGLFAALLTGILIGAASAWFLHRRICAQDTLRDITESVGGRIAIDVNVLTLLRAGEHDYLLEQREAALSDSLAILAIAGTNVAVPDKLLKPLGNALRYYEKYPISTGERGTDAAIMSFLENVRGGESPGR
jgi:hypothetical protein